MTIESQLEAARLAVENVSPITRSIYVFAVGLRQLCAEHETAFAAILATHPAPDPLRLGSGLNHIFTTTKSAFAEVATLRAARDQAEALPEVQAAIAEIEPMVAEVHRLEAALEAQQAAAAQAEFALQEAEAAALEKARAKVQDDPQVKKAREALAGIRRLGVPLDVVADRFHG